jgi:hypothetical protein
MTTYNTGNPIGSKDPRDLYDNAENLDEAVNTRQSESWDDRFGVARKTWWGMEQDFQQFLINSGYENIGDYGPGLEITARNQIFWKDGELYRAGASLALPYTTTGDWGTEEGLFVAVGDQALRQQLADSTDPANGAGMVGYKGSTVAAALEAAEDELDEIDLRLAGRGISSGFDGTGTIDISTRMQDLLNSDGVVILPSGNFKLSATVSLPAGSVVRGQGIGQTRIFRDTSVEPFDMFTGVGVQDILVSGVFFDSVQKEAVTNPDKRHCAFRFWDETYHPNPVDPAKKNQNIEIVGCRFDKFTSGETQPEGDRGVILLRNCEYVTIRDSFFNDNRATCVFWLMSNHVFVQNNFCLGEQLPYDDLFMPTQGLGSFTSGLANGVTVTGNRVFNTGYTSLNVSGVGVIVSDNYIQSPSFSGITVNETDVVTQRVVISGNYIGDPGLDGISVFNVEGCIISGNFIIGATTAVRAGITLYQTQPQFGPEIPRNVKITSNTIRSCASGVRIRSGAHIVSNGNDYSGNTVGITLKNESNLIITAYSLSDFFRDNTFCAIQLEQAESSSQRIQVTGALVHSSDINTSQTRAFISQSSLSQLHLGANTFSTNYDTSQVRTDFPSTGYALYSLSGGAVQALKTITGTP